MIDPKLLKEFEDYLTKLTGETLDETAILIREEKIMRWVVRFGIKPETARFYWFEIADCAWQILHSSLTVFSNIPDINKSDEAQLQLENLKGDRVANVQFNTEDFSLILNLDSGYALKLLHNKENSWHFSFWINEHVCGMGGHRKGHGLFYTIEDESIGQGVYDC